MGGFWNTQPGSPSICEACGAGFFCTGGLHREPCAAFQTTATETASSRSQCLCAPGAFLLGGACEVCPAGRFKSGTGNLPCEECVVGTWSNDTGAVENVCAPCMVGSTTEAAGARDLDSCVRPDVGHRRTCVSGRVCEVDGLSGYGLRAGHRMVLSRSPCDGSKTALPGVSQNAFSHPSTDGQRYVWGDVLQDFTPEGGTVNLCWCAGMAELSCSDINLNFWLTAGELSVVGPIQDNYFECVRGDDCDSLRSFRGHGLLASDGVAARRVQCGGKQSVALSRLLADGIGQLQDSGGDLALSFGKSTSTEDFWLTADASEGYLLCWCGVSGMIGGQGGQACSHPEEYAVPAGQLRIVGPRTNQEDSCSIGQYCAVHVEGVGVQPGDRLMVLNDCGHGSSVAGFPGGGIAETNDPRLKEF